MTRIAIEHGLVLTMDRADRVIEDGRVVVEGRDIVAVERCTDGPVLSCDLVIDATGRIVLPGLVNAHTHLCMVFGRTIGPERRLLEWLDLLMPMMAAMDEEALYLAELLGCVENIKNGNTSLVENIFMPPQATADPEDAAFRALRDSGIRGTVARATEARLFRSTVLRDRGRTRRAASNASPRAGTDPRAVAYASPSARSLPWVVDEDGFRETRRIARDNGLSSPHARGRVARIQPDDRSPFRSRDPASRAARRGRLPGPRRAGGRLFGRLAARDRAPGRERHRRPVRPSDAAFLGHRISPDRRFPDRGRDLRGRHERGRRELRAGHLREHEICMRHREDRRERSARAHRRARAPDGNRGGSARDQACRRQDPSRSASGPT